MKAIFLCHIADSDEVDNYSGISIAGNKFQNNIVKHMSKSFDDFEIVSIPPIAPFPTDRRLVYRKREISINEIKSIEIGFVNITGIKQICQIVSSFFEVKKHLKKDTILITYNLFPQIGIPALLIQKLKKCGLYTIVADLPIDNRVNRSALSKLFFRPGFSIANYLLNKAKNTVVLNEYAWRKYAVSSNHIVVDGGIDDDEYLSVKSNWKKYQYKKKNIMYCGSLDNYSGILNLVEAMKYVNNPDITLDIYGDGEMKDDINKLEHGNIIYHGRISNEKVIMYQKEAWILINPRPIDDPIAQVTFPSKIFEYMVSGTPVIATRLNGFSKEYEGKLIFAEDGSPKELARCINLADNMSDEELSLLAYAAFKFIGDNKLWSLQCKRISDFIMLKGE